MAPHSRALVTGASAGIGLSYAEHLARTGCALVLVARRRDRLETLATRLREAYGVEVEVLVADLVDPADVARVAERLGIEPGIDLLVNNAGYGVSGQVGGLDPAALAQMIQVNVVALAQLSHAAMKRMRVAGRGRIVNVGSSTVFAPLAGNAGYGSTKNFVTAFTRAMQVEAEGSGVEIQLLVPGITATEFHDVAGRDLTNFPPEMVMQVDDLVVASLRALEMGEAVCIPSHPDTTLWANYVEAEAACWADASHDKPAPRYHGA